MNCVSDFWQSESTSTEASFRSRGVLSISLFQPCGRLHLGYLGQQFAPSESRCRACSAGGQNNDHRVDARTSGWWGCECDRGIIDLSSEQTQSSASLLASCTSPCMDAKCSLSDAMCPSNATVFFILATTVLLLRSSHKRTNPTRPYQPWTHHLCLHRLLLPQSLRSIFQLQSFKAKSV
jgi:hypothetical protein